MDNKKILIILIFSIIGITIFSDMISSCEIVEVEGYKDIECTNYIGRWYKWSVDFKGGCGMGVLIDNNDYYYYRKDERGVCLPDYGKKWSISGSNGQICYLRWNRICDYGFVGSYDASTGTCVKCSGKIKTEQWYCSDNVGTKINVYKCETACHSSVSECCDDVEPNSYVSSESCKGYCDGVCDFTEWQLSIHSTDNTVKVGEVFHIIVESNLPINSSLNYSLEIVENGSVVKKCGEGRKCIYETFKTEEGVFEYYGRVTQEKYYGVIYQGLTTAVVSPSITVTVSAPSITVTVSAGACNVDADCAPDYCCNRRIGECVPRGTIYTTGNVSYICWWQSSDSGDGWGGPWE